MPFSFSRSFLNIFKKYDHKIYCHVQYNSLFETLVPVTVIGDIILYYLVTMSAFEFKDSSRVALNVLIFFEIGRRRNPIHLIR
jgi:hypothetical protein